MKMAQSDAYLFHSTASTSVGVGTVVQSQVTLPASESTADGDDGRGRTDATRTNEEGEGEGEGMGNLKFAAADATPSIAPEAVMLDGYTTEWFARFLQWKCC